MSELLIGFDSAWTARRSGALVGVARGEDGAIHELGPPMVASFPEAADQITTWQSQQGATTTVVMIDQPTIVTSASGQRPVEHIVSSPVKARRRAAIQQVAARHVRRRRAALGVLATLRRWG